jgi:hypothetical protein
MAAFYPGWHMQGLRCAMVMSAFGVFSFKGKQQREGEEASERSRFGRFACA